jgi:DNA anti-recombination protein RmuC
MVRAVSEKFVNNFVTIMVARIAMIVTPVLIAFFWWAGSEMWSNQERRLQAVEDILAKQASQIQDHESRIVFSDQTRAEFSTSIERRFTDLGGSLKDLNAQIGTINGSIIRLQTTIENRLPPRTANVGSTGAGADVPQP